MFYGITPKYARWYLTVTCAYCESKVVVFRDLNNGASDLKGTSYLVTCPRCGREGSFEAEHYQHRERRKPEFLLEDL